MKQGIRLLLVALLLAGACGGGASNALHSHVDDRHLAPASSLARTNISAAKKELFLANWQVLYTKSQLKTSGLAIQVAKNTLASAKIDVENATLELAAATERGDQNSIARSERSQRVATLGVAVRSVEIERAKQRVNMLEKRLVHEERLTKSSEAQLELTKASALQSAGISPPNFEAGKYKAQQVERARAARSAESIVTGERAKLAVLDTKLKAAQRAVALAKGVSTAKKAAPASKPIVAPAEPQKPAKQKEDTSPTPTAKTSEPPGEEAAPEDATPQEAAPEEVTSEKATSEKATPKEAATQEAAS